MPSSYSPDLRLELPADGEQTGLWGQTTNRNLGTLIESAIAGATSVSVTTADQALTALNGADDQSRHAMLALTTTTGANFAVYAPPTSKTYIVRNASSYTATIYNSTVLGNTTAAGAGVAVPAGKTLLVFSDGTDFRTIDAVNLTGTLAVANGGTGATDASGARTNLGLVIGTNVPSPTGTGASGTWNISILGNAATATNATNATNAGTVTNGVYTVGDQTIAGDKTFTGVTTFSNPFFYQTAFGIGFDMGPGAGTGDVNKQGFYVPAGKSLWLAGNSNGAVIELGPSGVTFPTGLTLPTYAVNAATAGSAVGGIGTYAYLYINRAISPGGTASASELLYAGEGGSNTPGVTGTWRAMGVRGAAGNTMFLRIA